MDTADPRSPRYLAYLEELKLDYLTKPKTIFWDHIKDKLSNRTLPLALALDIAECALDQRDFETSRFIVDELHRTGHDHPLLVEMDALAFLGFHQGAMALAVLHVGIEKWDRPYLRELRDAIEKVRPLDPRGSQEP